MKRLVGMKTAIRFGLAGATGLLFLGGCSVVDQVTNTGGDTTCGAFNSQDDSKQRAEVSKMLKVKNGHEPSNLELSAMQVAASAFCKTIGKDSDKISNAMMSLGAVASAVRPGAGQ